MAEYINKEKALKFLMQQADEAQKDAEDYGGESIIYAECLADVIEDLGRLPAADVAPVSWISVKDRLPDTETEVLAICNRNGFRFVCPAIYEDGTVLTQDSMWSWYDLDNYETYSEENDDYFIPEGWWENRQFTPDDVYNNPVDCEVTHWMPIPEPPRMDGKEK